MDSKSTDLKYSIPTYPDKYIQFSAIDRHSSVFEELLDTIVVIDGQEQPAKNIKEGDLVEHVYHGKKIHTKVKWCGTSPFHGTCFVGNCTVFSSSGVCFVNQLKIGDFVWSSSTNSFAKIICILENIVNSTIPMCTSSTGLCLTPYHPVKIEGKYHFPKNHDMFHHSMIHVDKLYSIALNNAESLTINNIEVIGLAHGIQNDPVATHPYFGTKKVIDDILTISPDGHAVITTSSIERDPEGLVCGIKVLNQ